MVNGNLLIVDDNEEILVSLMLFLREHFTKVHARKNPQEALDCLHSEDIDVFLLDMNLSPESSKGRDGIELKNTIRRINPHAVVVFIIEWGDAELANAAIKAGANNFIQKPWDDLKLLATVKSAMDLSKSRQLVASLREQQRNLHIDQHPDSQMIYGKSAAMKELMRTVGRIAGTAANVIILGENGTGKELLAREIHRRSERNAGVFIKADLGSLSESLAESELFGHVQGAFVDAFNDKPGSFEMAPEGTVFLDGFTSITPSLQVKLLNVLKNKKITRLGSNIAMDIDTRIISATNMFPQKLVLDKTFNKDLLSHLNAIRINLPPLRRRMEDLPLLVEFFLKKLDEKYRKNLGILHVALKKLEKHHWPGNIRELYNTLERAVILADHNKLSERDFLFKSRLIPVEGIAMVDLKQNEKAIIKKAIELNGGNLSRAARHLGISRRTLYNKITKYEI